MQKRFLLFALCLLAFSSTAFAQTIERRGEDVFVNGEKKFKVVQTKKMNVLTTEMPHFSFYDNNGVERVKFQNDKLLFVDSKSFIATDYVVSPNVKALTKFFGSDSLFTSAGYNKTYEEAFIKKYKGFYDNAVQVTKDANGLVERDKSKAVVLKGNVITQGESIIGYTEETSVNKVCTAKFAKEDKKIVAIATYTCDNLGKPADIDVTIKFDDGRKDVRINVYYLAKVRQEVAEWLVKEGYL